MKEKNRGDLIRKARIKKGYTQEELGRILNYSNNAIYSWEKGGSQPGYETLIRLSQVLDIPLLDLLYGEENTSEEDIVIGYFRIKKKYYMKYMILIILLLISIIIIGYLTYIYNIKGKISTYYISGIDEEVKIDGSLFISNDINILVVNEIDSYKDIKSIFLYYYDNDEVIDIIKGDNQYYYLENDNRINEYNLFNIEDKQIYLRLYYEDDYKDIELDKSIKYKNDKIDYYKEYENKSISSYSPLDRYGFKYEEGKYVKRCNNINVSYINKQLVINIYEDDYFGQIIKNRDSLYYEKIYRDGRYEKQEVNYKDLKDIFFCLNY